MAVVGSARPLFSKLHVDAELHRTYTSLYEVKTDSRSDGPLTAQGASGIPTIGDSYTWGSETDIWAFCNDGQVECRNPDETLKLWRITVQHSTRPRFRSASGGSATARQSPLDEPATIYGSFLTFTKPADRDKDGDLICNAVEEQKLIEIDDNRHSLVIEVNTENISLAMWKEYRVSVNSQPIWGLDTYQVKLKQWNWRVMYYAAATSFVSHHYEFEISSEPHPPGYPAHPSAWTYGWQSCFVNAGFRSLNPDADVADPAFYYLTNMDGRDQVLHQERNLDKDGNLISPADPTTWRVYDVYQEKDFRLLPGIPTTLPGPFV